MRFPVRQRCFIIGKYSKLFQTVIYKLSYNINAPLWMRPDACGIMTACGSLHLARKVCLHTLVYKLSYLR